MWISWLNAESNTFGEYTSRPSRAFFCCYLLAAQQLIVRDYAWKLKSYAADFCLLSRCSHIINGPLSTEAQESVNEPTSNNVLE